MKSHHPISAQDKAFLQKPTIFRRSADQSRYTLQAEGISKSMSLGIDPFSNGLSGTMLAQIRVLQALLSDPSLRASDIEVLEYLTLFASNLLFSTGGHTYNEFLSVLQLPEIKAGFEPLLSKGKLEISDLILCDKNGINNQLLDRCIIYIKTIHNKKLMNNELMRKNSIAENLTPQENSISSNSTNSNVSQQYCDISQQDIEKFIQAILTGDCKLISEMIAKKDISVDATFNKGITPLMFAVENNRAISVKHLLSLGANIHAVSVDNKTAIDYATDSNNTTLIKVLRSNSKPTLQSSDLKHPGLNLNNYTNKQEKNSKLIKATEIAIEATVDKLAASYSSKSQAKLSTHKTGFILKAFFNQSLFGKISSTSTLASIQPRVNEKHGVGQNALIYAVEWRRIDIVKELLENGAKVNEKNNYGQNALMCAASQGQTDIVKVLLENGAEVDAKDKQGKTPLMYAAERGHIDTVKALLEKGVKVNEKNNYGQNALTYAASQGQTDIVKVLLENGAKVDAKDEQGNISLMYTESQEHIDTVKELSENSAKADAKDEQGNTPLMYAESQEHIDTVKELSENSDSIEEQGLEASTGITELNKQPEQKKQLCQKDTALKATAKVAGGTLAVMTGLYATTAFGTLLAGGVKAALTSSAVPIAAIFKTVSAGIATGVTKVALLTGLSAHMATLLATAGFTGGMASIIGTAGIALAVALAVIAMAVAAYGMHRLYKHYNKKSEPPAPSGQASSSTVVYASTFSQKSKKREDSLGNKYSPHGV